jgi:membrane fusion protein, copper/silver efflux system
VLRKAAYIVPLAVASILGFVFGQFRTPAKVQGARNVLYYVDPMHPAYKSDKPGIAPDCGMKLVPVYVEDAGKLPLSSTAPGGGRIKIDPATQQLFGIRLTTVEKASGKENIRVLGRVAADETRVYRVNVGTDGFVKETYDDAVGNRVSKNQHLASIYSPEFLAVSGGYLSANERTPAATAKDSPLASGAASVQARADRLRNLGMSDAQIEEMTQSRKLPEDIYVVSPANGFILARSISPGLRFERHSEFYRIADLSRVWILASAFGRDARAFRPGAVARVTLLDTGETFRAHVSHVLPEVDPSTWALKIRLEADNPAFALRPDMFVNVELPVSVAPGLTVPADALLDSGLTKRVFVECGDGYFEPREVETGWRLEDRVQIVRGLRSGERVVSAGTFLVDSESRLQLTGNRDPTETGSAHRHE